jgi:hypothetical protein
LRSNRDTRREPYAGGGASAAVVGSWPAKGRRSSIETERAGERYTLQSSGGIMRSRRQIACVLLLMTIVVPSYARTGYSAMSETESFHTSSETKVFKHRISAPWTGARLKVAMRVEQGGATLRLVDASGSIRWEKTFESGEASIDETFSGKGIWRVDLRLRNATGRYKIQLIAI